MKKKTLGQFVKIFMIAGCICLVGGVALSWFIDSINGETILCDDSYCVAKGQRFIVDKPVDFKNGWSSILAIGKVNRGLIPKEAVKRVAYVIPKGTQFRITFLNPKDYIGYENNKKKYRESVTIEIEKLGEFHVSEQDQLIKMDITGVTGKKKGKSKLLTVTPEWMRNAEEAGMIYSI
ncbi:MAG: hypothetical protein ACKUBY_01635 [Candidatus Moraniibacteriota bacterium]